MLKYFKETHFQRGFFYITISIKIIIRPYNIVTLIKYFTPRFFLLQSFFSFFIITVVGLSNSKKNKHKNALLLIFLHSFLSFFLQIGKYWSKDERKKHLEKAKERRLKQLDMIQNKNESMRKSPSASGNLGGYRTKNNKSPITASPPPNTSASSNNGSSNPLMTSEPVLLSVTTV